MEILIDFCTLSKLGVRRISMGTAPNVKGDAALQINGLAGAGIARRVLGVLKFKMQVGRMCYFACWHLMVYHAHCIDLLVGDMNYLVQRVLSARAC